MVKNDLNEDIRELCKSEGITQADAGRLIGVNRQTITKFGQGRSISARFIELIDSMGYDIELRYVKR